MNLRDATTLVANLNRVGLLPAADGQAALWADALDDVAGADAIEAARRIVRTRTAGRPVTPGDVRAEVAAIRRARTADVEAPVPPRALDDDPHRTNAWLRAFWRAIGDGAPRHEADARACRAVRVEREWLEPTARPVRALIEETARALPRIEEER